MSQAGLFKISGFPPPPGTFVQFLEGDTGGMVPPDLTNTIHVVGGTGINTVGNPGTSTVTFNVDGTIPDTFTTDSGSAIPAAGVLNIFGAGGITTSGSGNTVTITGGGSLAETFDGNSGSATPAANVLNVVVNNLTNANYVDQSTVNFYGSGNTLRLTFSDQFDSTGVGFEALSNQTGGVNTGSNTAFGAFALRASTTGSNNTAIGNAAGVLISTGNNNSLLGINCAASLTTGDGNCILGDSTALNLVSGVGNFIAGGVDESGGGPISLIAGSAYTTNESYNIIIGNVGVIGDSNTIRIGTSGSSDMQQNRCFIGGIAGVNLATATVVTNTGLTDELGTAAITAGTGISISATTPNQIIISATGTTTLAYTNVTTSPYVVLTTDDYLSVDCSGGPITLEFPNAATVGKAWIVKDRTGNAATNNITVTTVGGAIPIDGAVTYVMNTNLSAIQIIGNNIAYEVF